MNDNLSDTLKSLRVGSLDEGNAGQEFKKRGIKNPPTEDEKGTKEYPSRDKKRPKLGDLMGEKSKREKEAALKKRNAELRKRKSGKVRIDDDPDYDKQKYAEKMRRRGSRREY